MPARPPHEESGYRLCYVEMVGLITLQGKDSHENPIFSGSLEGVFEMFVDLILGGADWNHTMVSSDKWTTKYDDGTYGGCTGSVDRNESDIILSPVDYPTQNFETVDPYGVFFEEPVAIVSTYNPTNGTIEVDILSAAATVFTWDLWLLVLTTFALSSLVWYLQNRNKAANNAMLQMFSLFMNQHSMVASSFFSKIFATFLSLGVFILVNYYCNMMTTEMVIPEKPPMFDSLDKVMSKPDTIPRFVSIFETYRVFKFAEEGNPKKKLWNKYAHLEETNEIFMDMTNIDSARNHIYQGYIGKAVTIMNRLWVPLLTSTSCKVLGASGHTNSSRLLSSPIFPEEVYQLGVVRNARLRTTDYGKYLKKRATLFFESGLAAFLRKEFERGMDLGPFDYEEFRKCMIDTYSDPDVNVSRVSMGNLKNVMLFYITCIVIALISLVVEKIMPKKRKVTKVHPIKEKITEKPSKFKRALVLSLDMRPFKKNTRRRSF